MSSGTPWHDRGGNWTSGWQQRPPALAPPASWQSPHASWQWPQGNTPPPHQPTEWRCNACNTTNFTPKTKCSCCNIKKSWAQIVAAPTTSQPAKPAYPFQAQLSRAADLVARATPPAPISVDEIPSASPPTRAALKAEIKQLDAAMAQLVGDSFQHMRDELGGQIEAKKRLIIDANPIGQRIDNTRAALSRALKRKQSAIDALADAQTVATVADDEVIRFTKELDELEAALAKSPAVMPDESPLIAMTTQINAVLAELSAVAGHEPTRLNDAKACARQFLDGMQKTFEHLIESSPTQGPPTRRRLSAAIPEDLPATEAPQTRHRSKRPAARTLGHFFVDAGPRYGPRKSRSRSPAAAGFRPAPAAEAPF
jgi:hypothetical protein